MQGYQIYTFKVILYILRKKFNLIYLGDKNDSK